MKILANFCHLTKKQIGKKLEIFVFLVQNPQKLKMGSLVATTTRKFDSYESIVKLTLAKMQQALAERGVMVAKPDKTTLTSLLLKSVCGEF
jgi:hypothetical protein